MNRKTAPKITDDAPITQAYIDSGRLVLSKRGASYPVEVSWSDEDKGYIATLLDLPGCSAWAILKYGEDFELEPSKA